MDPSNPTRILVIEDNPTDREICKRYLHQSRNGTFEFAESGSIAGATVFLRNTKSKSIRSYTSTKDGRFRFAQVDMSEDFDLWAEKDGKKSPTKTISSWDTRKDVETELKIK